MSFEFFATLKDEDFFTNKLHHIYFNSVVDQKSVDKLIDDIKNANAVDNPKPILIHISSQGGNVHEGYRFLTLFDISRVPIATIIDNHAFSAATFLAMSSSYRLMTKEAYCLLHDYSITFNQGIPLSKSNISNITSYLETYFDNIIELYIKKTNIKRQELSDILQHDIYLDSNECLKKGIVHRVVDYEAKNIPVFSQNVKDIIQNPNMIQINLNPCIQYSSNIDYTIMHNNDENKQFVLYPQYNSTIKHNSCDDDIQPTIFSHLNLITKVKHIKGLKIAIIDNPISIDNLLPLLYTHRIYMYEHTFIICNLLYLYNLKPSILVDDIAKNNKTIFTLIKHILKTKTKMNMQQINDINKKYSIISSTDAKKLKLCHEIIHIS